MDLELVTIGTELVLGFTLDTNAALLGRSLAEAGIRVARHTSVPDDPAAVSDAVAAALDRTRFVITTGGLGPTSDDLTKHAVGSLLGLPLEFCPPLWEELRARFARMGRTLAERNRCQAEVPRGAAILPNPRGTAPGLWVAGPRGEVVMLPGVPAELRGLLAEEVIPRLASRSARTTIRSALVRTTGLAESAVAERLAPLEPRLAPVTVAYLPSLDGVDIRLTAWDRPRDEADRLLGPAVERVQTLLEGHAYGTGEDDLAARMLEGCRSARVSLAVAESCTGGLIGARITAVPGSSEVFAGGLIAYADRLKEGLGVPARILEAHGAVSEEAAIAMARGARERYGVDLALGVTGVAGPGGGSDLKPVGLVWFGIADASGQASYRWVFPGSRHEVRARAAQFALWKLWLRARRFESAGASPG